MKQKNLWNCFFYTLSIVIASSEEQRQTYIIYMGDLPRYQRSVVDDHHAMLSNAVGGDMAARDIRIHSYRRSFNGFAARLLPHEVENLSRDSRVVSVFKNRINKLRTTRSWDFVGMTKEVPRRPNVESSIIVGVIDTGIFSDAPSFNGNGYGPAPEKWRGTCANGANFTGCNNKIIGAKYYMLDKDSNDDVPPMNPTPADDDGHGTHTASTAAGDLVQNANLYGIANGAARGGVPLARIAVYKSCWGGGCSDMDMLAAFDDAIADGVDVITASIGGPVRDFMEDPIAIGSYHAAQRGIVTACSAGNGGPTLGSVENVAPWIITVGASTVDRKFETRVKLGNGMEATGISINTFSPTMSPLTSGALAAGGDSDYPGDASACDYGSLNMEKVKGRIVHCEGSNAQDYTVGELKGAGVIMTTDQQVETAATSLVPAVTLPLNYSRIIDNYINSTRNASATVYKTTTTITSGNYPTTATFSARGPQPLSINILKPDILAPGINILAAYSKLVSITGDNDDSRHGSFNILSGTSMACPHVAGAAAYVKSFHPDWSPAAIKSALMTTATPMKLQGSEKELGYGSGQINPSKAVDPGLVYDISQSSYISFLCKQGYNASALSLIIGGRKTYNCSEFAPAEGTDGLNYPSMHLQVESNARVAAVFVRTATHVGDGESVYKASVQSSEGMVVKVFPNVLEFSKTNQKRTFKVVVAGPPIKGGAVLSGKVTWQDKSHTVTTPILVCERNSF